MQIQEGHHRGQDEDEHERVLARELELQRRQEQLDEPVKREARKSGSESVAARAEAPAQNTLLFHELHQKQSLISAPKRTQPAFTCPPAEYTWPGITAESAESASLTLFQTQVLVAAS